MIMQTNMQEIAGNVKGCHQWWTGETDKCCKQSIKCTYSHGINDYGFGGGG